MKKRQLIIDGKQKPGKRVVEYFVTLSGWVYIFVFLIQISLSVLLWAGGIHYLRRFIISAGYITQTVDLTMFTFEFSLVVLLATLYWSLYNKFRYGKLNRRTMPSDVSAAELAKEFSVTEEFIIDLQNRRWVDLEGEIYTRLELG
ncbi:poly-beta-1,6-N-acetyl-D-glucosamine biosynthesis protein PgaD [Alicyclobacillus sp. TC]|uniref:poly-beta-1,6-N-acetyl-D-glucosamine biosynthesis protein PgaD n=1 Tax=Alicyclobacillus TaxID=29330 RepID=UPI0019312E81|nr:poly-beta-1,6-N-acetyl-D-glucosamine biosynthesis protein PgaD [Alicyclobacillus tengchongensis]QRF23551.1 poly-beta-1,6-N-acetyl-D-glucosamine biosynthesis protein PgaD [Alicyclobacillus sp. TC]